MGFFADIKIILVSLNERILLMFHYIFVDFQVQRNSVFLPLLVYNACLFLTMNSGVFAFKCMLHPKTKKFHLFHTSTFTFEAKDECDFTKRDINYIF